MGIEDDDRGNSLQEKIDKVIQEHFTENGGGFSKAWYLIFDGIDNDGDEIWGYRTSPDQNMMTTMGMLEWAMGMNKYEQHRFFEDGGGQ